jgi:hypothetical protein
MWGDSRLDCSQKFIVSRWLEEEGEGTGTHRLFAYDPIICAGHENDLGRRRIFTEECLHFEPSYHRHPYIEYDDRGAMGLGMGEEREGIIKCCYLPTCRANQSTSCLQHRLIIINQTNGQRLFVQRGIQTVRIGYAFRGSAGCIGAEEQRRLVKRADRSEQMPAWWRFK